nr:hypothetical protein [Tanacetum cinerariifolium]
MYDGNLGLIVVDPLEVDLISYSDSDPVISSLPSLYASSWQHVSKMKDPFDLSKVKGYRSSYKKEHIKAGNDLATATFPFLSKVVADPSTLIEVLLSKKPYSLQRPAPSRTLMPASSAPSPHVTPIATLVSKMKDPFDLSNVKGYRSSYKKEHIKAGNDLATATFPFLSEVVADPSTPIEVLLSKKPYSLQRPAPSRTLMPASSA